MSEPAVAIDPKQADLTDPKLYINRELSLLAFQRRVLEEAQDQQTPLLERPKFLSILFSNLDEFFMVRMARLQQQIASRSSETGPDGMSSSAMLETARKLVIELLGEAYSLYNQDLLPALRRAGITITPYGDLDAAQRKHADEYFHDTVFPVLTPLAFDPGRPFPHISNLSLSIAVVVKKPNGHEHFGRVKVPNTLPQLVPVPVRSGTDCTNEFVWLDEMITANMQLLFPGTHIKGTYPFHVTRDAEVAIQETETADLLDTIEEAVWSRRFRDVVRLQIHHGMPHKILEILTTNLDVTPNEIYYVDGPIDLGRLKYLTADRPELKDNPYVPALPRGLRPETNQDIFARIKRGPILLHHPYDSFQPVIEFLRQAAHDPDVMAIKATLYRVGKNSPIVQALLDAVENGKQVATLVELKARFDEESNIEWAKELESEGVHVVYGLPGLKVHCKVLLVVRREGDKMRRYLHLGTGNYNAVTARLYTDLGLLISDEAIGSDATELFNYLTGYSVDHHFQKLMVAPFTIRERMTELIEREITHQEQGQETHLIFKMNALEDSGMIELLYKASRAGVKIDLFVRGICCLRPGIPGLSENIRVISIIGRYLEHSRIYYFRNAGKEEVYLGSADLMPRNLNRRVEVIFPVENRHLVRHLRNDILEIYLRDRATARQLQADGTYVRLRDENNNDGLNAQTTFMEKHSQATAAEPLT